jgi:biotin carboxylase
MEKECLMIVGAGIETIPGIIRAQELGFSVVSSDGEVNAPGRKISDFFINASTYDPDDTVKKAIKFNKTTCSISGVMCLGSDVPHTVASVAERLGLPGISLKSAYTSIDKAAMKDCFSASQISVPPYKLLSSNSHDLENFVTNYDSPWVLKPVDSRGARGVSRICSKDELLIGFRNAVKNSPSKRVLIEQFIEGTQISTESIVIDGICKTVGYANRNYEFLEKFAPFIIENGGELPPAIDKKIIHKINEELQKASDALGISNGILKGDIVINQEEVFIIEVATRLSGGYFCTHEIPLNTGVDFVGLAIMQAMGKKIDLSDINPKFNKPVVQRYLFPNPGTIKEIFVPEWIYEDPEIIMCEIRISKGQEITEINSHPSRGGVIIGCGENIKNLTAKVERAISGIVVKYN